MSQKTDGRSRSWLKMRGIWGVIWSLRAPRGQARGMTSIITFSNLGFWIRYHIMSIYKHLCWRGNQPTILPSKGFEIITINESSKIFLEIIHRKKYLFWSIKASTLWKDKALPVTQLTRQTIRETKEKLFIRVLFQRHWSPRAHNGRCRNFFT